MHPKRPPWPGSWRGCWRSVARGDADAAEYMKQKATRATHAQPLLLYAWTLPSGREGFLHLQQNRLVVAGGLVDHVAVFQLERPASERLHAEACTEYHVIA